jgi:photosystem II stability/assembly factor-like uncharacterized protein
MVAVKACRKKTSPQKSGSEIIKRGEAMQRDKLLLMIVLVGCTSPKIKTSEGLSLEPVQPVTIMTTAPMSQAAQLAPLNSLSDLPTIEPSVLTDVWGSSATDVYIVGKSGLILHSKDSGESWQRKSSGTEEHLHSVWGSAVDDVYVAGEKGTLLHSKDSGASWQKRDPGFTEGLTTIWGSSANDLYLLGHSEEKGGVILHSKNKGVSWQKSKETGLVANGIWGSSAKDVYVVLGEDISRILHTKNSGKSWQVQHNLEEEPYASMGQGLSKIWGSGANDIYAMGYPYSYHSNDLGKTWKPLNSEFKVVTKQEQSWAANFTIWGSAANDFYVIQDSRIIRHVVSGKVLENTTLTTTLDDLFFYGIWGSSAHDIYLIGNHWDTGGVILHSGDAGASWRQQSLPLN